VAGVYSKLIKYTQTLINNKKCQATLITKKSIKFNKNGQISVRIGAEWNAMVANTKYIPARG